SARLRDIVCGPGVRAGVLVNVARIFLQGALLAARRNRLARHVEVSPVSERRKFRPQRFPVGLLQHLRILFQRMTRTVRATRGTEISARSWLTEAPLRMLMNNLDPEVAERPEDLVVYGGIGKAARNWECYDAIVASLRKLERGQT